jgi:hypothetical protein
MLEKIQLKICPNPDCQKSFEDPIIISDHSKTPALTYYGCPNCLYELDPTSLKVLEKTEKVVKPKNTIKMQSSEEKTIKNCPKYIGYLFDLPKDSIIPYECLNCPIMNKCISNCSYVKH